MLLVSDVDCFTCTLAMHCAGWDCDEDVLGLGWLGDFNVLGGLVVGAAFQGLCSRFLIQGIALHAHWQRRVAVVVCWTCGDVAWRP